MKRPAAKRKYKELPPPAPCSRCEDRDNEELFQFEYELKALEKASWTVPERRSLRMTAANTLRRTPTTRAELFRCLVMLHVIERF